MRSRFGLLLACGWWLIPSLAMAQVTVVLDDFELGSFSTDWDAIDGSALSVISSPGDGAGGSDFYSRIEGVGGGAGGLGVGLTDLTSGSLFSTDFSATFDFRVDNTTNRQFNFQVSGGNPSPNTSSATINLRYQSNTWSAFNGNNWIGIGGLGTVTPGQWNSLTITGNNWGTGVSGTADYDISLTNHLSVNTAATGVQVFHADNQDSGGARSLNFNDAFGSNPGYDLDNVNITATPAPVPPATTTITPINPVAYSGIYPHTAVTNTHSEVAVGALVNRGGKVWFVTYGPHVTAGGTDELYSVDTTTLERVTYNAYPGNTDANRYTDTNLGIDVVGAAYIDTNENVRFLPATNPGAGDLVGRITGTAAHLTDPNKLYYMTMEEGLYEVDFSDLDNPVITTLRTDGNHDGQGGFQKNLPGIHGKGLYSGQGHLYFTNNGVGNGGQGGLVEWDGTGDPEQLSAWTIADDTAQYTEVTSRNGPVDMDPNSTDAIWATGWDDESLFINTRDAATGEWTKIRMPKSSYTHGHPNGWYTEWPRIRDVGLAGGHLMSHHGMMFLIPETFDKDNYGGVTPLLSHHKMVVDYVEDGDQIVFAGNDASQFSNPLVQKANSNLLFLDKADLPSYGGNAKGFGGVWVNDTVAAGVASDAFLINGYRDRVIHFEHENTTAVNYTVQIDALGNGNWTNHTVVSVPAGGAVGPGYTYYVIPEGLSAEAIRFIPQSNANSVSAYLHVGNGNKAVNAAQLASLAKADAPVARSQGVLRSMSNADFSLEFAADRLDASGNIVGTGYYHAQLNPTTLALEIVSVNDPTAESNLRSGAATTQDYGVDTASVFVDDGGTRYRLPMGNSAFDSATASGARRGMREVVTEREVMNIHGTFYELPRNFTGGGIERIVPITTHNLEIFDFATWRGMLVLSGVIDGGAADGHYVESDDGEVGLWFGNVDDLWTFGAPVGVGGPWNDTAVAADEVSDQYLMAGYDHKVLELSHDSLTAVDFTIEVDFLGTNQWETYDVLTVNPGETLTHIFESGYSAHWVRLISDTATNATAWFTYSEAVAAALAGDFNGDGIVDGGDFAYWRNNLGADESVLNGAGDGRGVVDADDLQVWRDNFGATSSPAAVGQSLAIPEPSALAFATALVALSSFRRCPFLSRRGQ